MNTFHKWKKVGVVGSTHYTDKKRVYFELDELRRIAPLIDTVVSGGAAGADRFGKDYAQDKKLKYIEHAAQWDDMSEPCFKKVNRRGAVYNALAGFKRNTKIVEDADVFLVFWDTRSPGTKDTYEKIKKSGKPIKLITF